MFIWSARNLNDEQQKLKDENVNNVSLSDNVVCFFFAHVLFPYFTRMNGSSAASDGNSLAGDR